jgi:hypothetical protein
MRRPMLLFTAVLLSLAVSAQNTPKPDADGKKKIPANAKFFLDPMGGFEEDLKAAIVTKKVPVVLVTDKGQADYEIAGTSETEKAGAAKKVIMLDWHSNEQASITVTERKSGEVVFAYSVNKKSSAHGKRSTAEACAKHLKDEIERK